MIYGGSLYSSGSGSIIIIQTKYGGSVNINAAIDTKIISEGRGNIEFKGTSLRIIPYSTTEESAIAAIDTGSITLNFNRNIQLGDPPIPLKSFQN